MSLSQTAQPCAPNDDTEGAAKADGAVDGDVSVLSAPSRHVGQVEIVREGEVSTSLASGGVGSSGIGVWFALRIEKVFSHHSERSTRAERASAACRAAR